MATTTTTGKAGKDGNGNALHLLVREERKDGYFHLRAQVVIQKYESAEVSGWKPYGVEDSYSDGLLWTGLQVSCQGDKDSRVRMGEGDRGAVYGFDVEYRDVWSVDLRKARRMSKTLDKIEKGMARLSEQRGYVRSYGEYLGRVAEVLGCAGIGIDGTPGRYGSRYRWMSIGDGVNAANHLIYCWQQEAVERLQLTAGEGVAS
jgi:hypothetical protein